MRQAPSIVVICDDCGKVQYANPAFEEQVGYGVDELIAEGPFFRTKAESPEKTFQEIKRVLITGQRWQEIFTLETKDGSERKYELLASPIFSESGELINIIVLGLDITEKTELHNQLNHIQKMDAVGRMAAHFAHEFGNPLLGVRSVIKDICERISLEEGDRQLLKIAYEECERMKILIRDFQQFQRSGNSEKGYFDIHEILDKVLVFYQKHFEKHSIELERRYFSGLPEVFVCRDEIAQVFLNLIINGVDAMAGKGGVLTVTTTLKGGGIGIDLEDSGCGIEEDERELIFEPLLYDKTGGTGDGIGAVDFVQHYCSARW